MIRVCHPCNSNIGQNSDSRISRFTGLRAMGWFTENMMKRQERHESHAVLKDGRELEGYFYWIPAGEGKYRVGFEPSKLQLDGSIWIMERACQDASKLPSGYNVFREEMLDMASVSFTDPTVAGLEPAMIKILLGMMYLHHGREVISLPGFDIMRSCLSGNIPPQVSVNWLRSIDELRARWPFTVRDTAHIMWGGCSDKQIFKGGVSLFGKTIVEISIRPFGHIVSERAITMSPIIRHE